jgi:hypothetical protein
MTPLNMPQPKKQLNLSLLYQRQSRLKETQEDMMELENEELQEDHMLERMKLRNEINYRILERIFKYAAERKQEFTFSELYEHIATKTKRLFAYTENRCIFVVMLKLYEINIVNLSIWKNRNKEDTLVDANGEFDLAWCLYHLEYNHPDFYGVKSLIIEKADNEYFETELEEQIGEEKRKSKISMNDFIFTPEFGRLGEVE